MARRSAIAAPFGGIVHLTNVPVEVVKYEMTPVVAQ
jgi:hypothetical protein